MESKNWCGWRTLTEIIIVNYFVKNNIPETQQFTNKELFEEYREVIHKIRPSNVDITGTINQELQLLVRTGSLTRPVRGIYKIIPESYLMKRIYYKKFEMEFEILYNEIQ